MDHLERTRHEFARQAAGFSESAATTDQAQVALLVGALGEAGCGRVLDVACGPGIVASALAGTAREVVAFDLTPEMLAKAEERCRKDGRTNVVFAEGSATSMPFADLSFNAVITRLSLHHFSEPSIVVAEMLRVLKSGGVLAVADVVSSEDAEKAALQNAIERLRDPSHVRMLPASELVALMSRRELSIERQDTWQKAREFEEWAGIVSDPERIAPLRAVVRALAKAGQDAEMGLSIRDGTVHFFHRWRLIVARKS